MNRTIISIELQDEGGTEATIIVKGERNNQIMFEEQFAYEDKEKHPLRLHLLKERFIEKHFAEGKSLGVMSIHKLLKDITERSKSVGVPDYRDKGIIKKSIHLHGYNEIANFFKGEFAGKEKELNEYVTQLLQYPDGTSFGLPTHYLIEGNQVVVNRKSQEVVIFHS
jgi:hypothetical protein